MTIATSEQVGRRPTVAPSRHALERLPLPPEFIAAVVSKTKVSACPHNLYKYPARFAPEFAREAIQGFSQPGDTVLDPFNGSGTTMIEAVALNRYAVGYDISALACFLARAKTTPLTVHDQRALVSWSARLSDGNTQAASAAWQKADTDAGYYRRNLPDGALAFFSSTIAALKRLTNARQRRFARLVLLSVGQGALDCRKSLPKSESLRDEYRRQLQESVANFRGYWRVVAKRLRIAPRLLEARRQVVRASSEICGEGGRPPSKKAALIVTSPPYPGVHMLYHRWQILGRRETPAPFVLADCRDGDGLSFYTLGHRHEGKLKTYYERLTKIYAAARNCIRDDALVVQMVAFGHPEWQLPAFLNAMSAAGYVQAMPKLPPEMRLDGNLWRRVPGRKWYVNTRKAGSAGNEVVLFHRPKVLKANRARM